MNLNWIVGVLVVVIIALGGDWYVSTRIPAPIAGAVSGPTFYNFVQFLSGESNVNRVIASSTIASVTLAGTEFVYNDELDYTINVGPTNTLTLPASTTPMCSSLQKGEQRTLTIRDASTTAGTNLKIAGSSGIVLKSASSTLASATPTTITGTTDGSGFGLLTIIKLPSTNCSALLTVFN